MASGSGIYICNACGWEYDPAQGDPDGGIPPGTPWEDVPEDWVCPVCGVGKEDFEPVAVSAEVTAAAAPALAPVVIVGSGLAGYTVAKELRKRDAGIPICLVTADSGEVYTKPMLSNALARGHHADAMVQKQAADLAAEIDIEVRVRNRVLGIDPKARTLRVEAHAGEAELAYGRLVLALGADARVFPVPGADQLDVFTVNDLDDYRFWRSRIGTEGHVLLIGAGLIGCEFANDLATAGFKVSLVDPAPWPLARLLPEAIGGMLSTALGGIGCELYLGRTVARYRATESGVVAELDDGTTVAFDHVLSAVGLAPRKALAAAAGLAVKAGIVTDRLMRTSDPNVYAVGDCAETEAGPLPFIAPLLAQAKALAATLAGEPTPLQLPALPVVVKTPALPLVVCPPPPGADGAWEVELGEGAAVAVFRAGDGQEAGFALAGTATARQRELAQRMPDLLPALVEAPSVTQEGVAETAASYACEVCGYVYDPAAGDPDGGVAPGTRWEDVPEDWVCPRCGAGKEEFTRLH